LLSCLQDLQVEVEGEDQTQAVDPRLDDSPALHVGSLALFRQVEESDVLHDKGQSKHLRHVLEIVLVPRQNHIYVGEEADY